MGDQPPVNTISTCLETATFDLGEFILQSGERLPQAQLFYASAGRLNAQGDNCIIMPAPFRGGIETYANMIGPGGLIDTDRYFVVVPTLFGSGYSSSSSNSAWVSPETPFPSVTIGDNVRAQARLLFDHLGVRHIRLASGWSMGAMQAYGWAALFPDRVSALLPWCGSFQCWPLNKLFLDGVIAALCADPAYRRGARSRPERGLRAFATIYAGWVFSATFYREELYRTLGLASAEELVAAWQADHLDFDPDDLLTMIGTWQNANPQNLIPGLGLAEALGRIRARTIVMPCDTDAYFTVKESAIEVSLIPNAELRVISSPYGHVAGFYGVLEEESRLMAAAFNDLLSDPD